MGNGRAAVSAMLGGVDLEKFVDRCYLRLPFVGQNAPSPWSESEDSDTLQNLLQAPQADVIVGRQGTPYKGPMPRSSDEAERLGTMGYTIGIRGVQDTHSGVAEIAEAFAKFFQAAVDVHLFVTPDQTPGFGWHYDAEEVFIVQVRGDKLWQLQKNTVSPWPLIDEIPRNQKHEREIMPVQECRMGPGDWLYIPGGYWHRTVAGSRSVSLSIGVNAITALDYFDFLRSQLTRSILWRQRLPLVHPRGAGDGAKFDGAALAAYRAIIESLLEDLSVTMASDYCLQSFLESKQKQASESIVAAQESEPSNC